MSGVVIPVRDDIARHLDKYARIRALLENDETQYESDAFCMTLPNEPPNAKAVRRKLLARSFCNITHDLLSATKDAIFNEQVRLDYTDGHSNPLSLWAKNVTRGGDDVSLLTYAADVVTYGLRAYGHVWTIMDKPNVNVSSFDEELRFGAPYLSNVYPGNVLNYEIVNGDLVWFAYKCPYHKPWMNPLSPPPAQGAKTEIRIWTPTEYIVVRENKIVPNESITHNFGFVPVVNQSFISPPDDDSIVGISPFFTSSNMIIYANNMQSVADMELFKHGSSVLLVQEDSVNSLNTEVDEKGVAKTKIQDARGYNKYVYSGDKPPQYLTKDLQAVDKANRQADAYFMAAIQNERTMQSMFRKRDTVRESGETKTYDAEPVRAALRATAQDLELWCTKVLDMAAKLFGRPELTKSFTCQFPDRYIMGSSADEKFKRIEYMIKTRYPSATGMKEVYKALTPDIAHNDAIREVINQEIEDSDINVNYDALLQEEVDLEMAEETEFEESIADLSDEDKETARAKRKIAPTPKKERELNDAWWAGLSEKAKKNYLQRHPKSRYGVDK